MRVARFVCAIVTLMIWASRSQAITLSFDDISPGSDLTYYQQTYGIGMHSGFHVADHTGSPWGPPHSGSNVLAWSYPGWWSNWYGMIFKKNLVPFEVESISGYFSTEPGTMLQMIGYHTGMDNPVVSAFIGASGESWSNVNVQISSVIGLTSVEFRPVTTDALSHFCADDMTITLVPEPSSLLALAGGLMGLGGLALRRRRR